MNRLAYGGGLYDDATVRTNNCGDHFRVHVEPCPLWEIPFGERGAGCNRLHPVSRK